jgi:RNA polymerase sigma-70 factor, ECF subfamily
MTDPLRRPPHLRIVRGPEPDGDMPPTQADLDPLRFDALYRRYAAYVAAIAVRLLGRDGEVDDLVQDVFVQVLRGLGRLRDPAAFKGWLAQITVRTATRRLRQRNLRRALHSFEAPIDYEVLAAPAATPDQRALLARVYRVLDRLPAKSRVIWILRNVLDEPLHVVAELAECSQSTVQRRLIDAQAALDEELSHE